MQWLAVTTAPAAIVAPPAVELTPLVRPPDALHRVAAGAEHHALEAALVRCLRVRPAEAVVHLGLGGRGSVNVAWLADRMGSAAFAVVHAAEIVCQRGDRVDERGRPCAVTDQPERCRVCCAAGWLRRPAAADFHNRLDLIMAGLQACTGVFVRSAADQALLEGLGVPRRALRIEPEFAAERLAAHVLASALGAGRPG